MNTNEVFEDLLKLPTPKIILSGKVDREMRNRVFRSLTFLTTKGSPDVEIIIESSGGEVSHGLDIYDALRLYQGKKKGIVISEAGSMAAIILQACDTRQCASHAYILVHNGDCRIKFDVLFDDAALAAFKKEKQETLSLLHTILSTKTGKEDREVVEMCKPDKWITAQKALELGLIDEIV